MSAESTMIDQLATLDPKSIIAFLHALKRERLEDIADELGVGPKNGYLAYYVESAISRRTAQFNFSGEINVSETSDGKFHYHTKVSEAVNEMTESQHLKSTVGFDTWVKASQHGRKIAVQEAKKFIEKLETTPCYTK